MLCILFVDSSNGSSWTLFLLVDRIERWYGTYVYHIIDTVLLVVIVCIFSVYIHVCSYYWRKTFWLEKTDSSIYKIEKCKVLWGNSKDKILCCRSFTFFICACTPLVSFIPWSSCWVDSSLIGRFHFSLIDWVRWYS